MRTRSTKPTRLTLSVAVLASLALPLAACGNDSSDDASDAAPSAESVTVSNPWARPADAGANSAVYMELTGGDVTDSLVEASVSTGVASEAQLHQTMTGDSGTGDSDSGNSMSPSMSTDSMSGASMTHDTSTDSSGTDNSGTGDSGSEGPVYADDGNDMMSMEPVESIQVPAGETVHLEPGGYHIMMVELAKDLEVGDTFDMTLTFENSGEQTISVEVTDG